MCDDCKQITLQAQVLIGAIDKNREALAAVFEQLHRDMQGKLILHNNPDGSQTPVNLQENYLGQVLMAQYVAAFLAGECPDQDDLEDSILTFYDTGFDHGSAYAGARQAQLN